MHVLCPMIGFSDVEIYADFYAHLAKRFYFLVRI